MVFSLSQNFFAYICERSEPEQRCSTCFINETNEDYLAKIHFFCISTTWNEHSCLTKSPIPPSAIFYMFKNIPLTLCSSHFFSYFCPSTPKTIDNETELPLSAYGLIKTLPKDYSLEKNCLLTPYYIRREWNEPAPRTRTQHGMLDGRPRLVDMGLHGQVCRI